VPESLLTILKFLLIALLYLFFFRVLRAVWAEVTSPRTVSAGAPPAGRTGVRDRMPAASPKGTPSRLRVLEPSEHRGRAYDLAEEMTVGRAQGCQVQIEDSYASQLHARVFRRDGQVFVEDIGSTNGTYVNRKGTKNKEKVSGPLALRLGDRLVIGKTVLEVTR
jgi:pSer/pThr/pTyr-binding forkhead associated (FHA) protein